MNYLCWIILGLVAGDVHSEVSSSEAIAQDPHLLTQSAEATLGGPLVGLEDKASYAAEGFRSDQTIKIVSEPNGTISLPARDVTDSRLEWLWVFDLGSARGYGIEINLTRMNLLVPGRLHGEEDRANVSNGDFLIVGPGRDVLGSTEEKLFWGVKNKTVSLHVPSPLAHVYLNLALLAANHSNSTEPVFVLHYRRTGNPITTPDPSDTTTTLPPPPANIVVSDWVALNGIKPNEAKREDVLLSVRQTTVSIANDFATSNNMDLEDEVREEDVIVILVMTCHPLYCWTNCAAYNISVRAYYRSDGSWAFTGDLISQMFADRKYDSYWANAKFPARVCVEAPIEGKGEWDTWLVATGFTVLSLLFFIMVWRTQRYFSMIQKRKDFEKQLLEVEKDRARRQSGEVSMLGLGVWGDSVASRDSRRLSLPFPKMRTDSRFSEEEGEDVSDMDLHDYQEYIPDRIYLDASTLGLDAGFKEGRDGSYLNAAFTADEDITGNEADNEDILYERRPSPVTMDSDSDDPDAINFRSYSKSQTSVRRVSTTADVHDGGETSL
ncbi:uncharacterized protein LOC122261613 isoform X2 [Penaeus japonicus]|uniref:uncharacterized protein LOC122261613 isoform X2 n=1 Tax=Penaeus japonicus TaxID=27405 RepID=UPI001C713760|nr:uncharacterized protein LOC122261613 isoform X2 [Penaeus japonicus]